MSFPLAKQVIVQCSLGGGMYVTVLDKEDRMPLLLMVKGNFGKVASAINRKGATQTHHMSMRRVCRAIC